MTSRYEFPEAGEWIRPKPTGYKLACCDCGLTHRLDFQIVGGHVEFRVWPANRETGQIRRHMKPALAAPATVADRIDQHMEDSDASPNGQPYGDPAEPAGAGLRAALLPMARMAHSLATRFPRSLAVDHSTETFADCPSELCTKARAALAAAPERAALDVALAEFDNIRWDDIWSRVDASGDDELARMSRKYSLYVRDAIVEARAALAAEEQP